jgi:peroxiredoxin
MTKYGFGSLLIASCALCACTPSSTGSPASSTAAAAEPSSGRGARPPDFELDSLDGRTVRLSDHLGKDVVLIDFWATFCDPCLAAMPHLDALFRKHQGAGFVVLGISIDGPDSIAQVKTEVAKLGVTFPILLDQETRVVALYNPKTSAPYSVLVGRDGTILAKKEGYTTGDTSQLEADVAAALALAPPSVQRGKAAALPPSTVSTAPVVAWALAR